MVVGGSAAKSKVITTATAKCCDIGWEEDDWMDVVGNERLNSTRPLPLTTVAVGIAKE